MVIVTDHITSKVFEGLRCVVLVTPVSVAETLRVIGDGATYIVAGDEELQPPLKVGDVLYATGVDVVTFQRTKRGSPQRWEIAL